MTSSTPLPPITRRTRKQLEVFTRGLPNCYQSWKADNGYFVEEVLETKDGRAAVSVAKDLVDAGSLQPKVIMPILTSAYGAKSGIVLINALRIAALLVSRGQLDENQAAEWQPMVENQKWSETILSTVRGLAENIKAIRLFTTAEELATAAATVLFSIQLSAHHLDYGSHAPEGSGLEYAQDWLRVKNPYLKTLVTDRPDDIDRIIAYVQTRGMHKSRRRDVDQLRDWLDSGGQTAFLSGLL